MAEMLAHFPGLWPLHHTKSLSQESGDQKAADALETDGDHVALFKGKGGTSFSEDNEGNRQRW